MSIDEILSNDTGDSSLLHNLAARGRELEQENANLRWLISKVNQSAWDDLKAENSRLKEAREIDGVEACRIKNAIAKF